MLKLFSCLYGSRLYGTTHPDSDTDIKYVVLPDLDSLLLGVAPKNLVEKTNFASNKGNGPNDVDEEFIPLHVFARDFLNGESYALELAFAVEYTAADQVIYDPGFLRFVSELREYFLTSDIFALMRFSEHLSNLYTVKADRLNAATEVLAVFQKYPALDKIADHVEAFERDMQPIERKYSDCVTITTYDNGNGSMAPCLNLLTRTMPYTASFGYCIKMIDSIISSYGARTKKAAKQNVDWKAAMHAYRVVNEGITLLAGGRLIFPYTPLYIESLLSIRRGDIPYPEVAERITEAQSTLRKLSETSRLPKNTPELQAKLETWLLSWIKRFYGLPLDLGDLENESE